MVKENNIKNNFLMTEQEGLIWHEFKGELGPIYPGYESFDIYMITVHIY